MKVSYVTMQFPLPSETFAARDIRAIEQKVSEVEVYSMRTAHPEEERLSDEQRVGHIRRTSMTGQTLLKGCYYAITQPFLLIGLVSWLISHEAKHPKEMIKCFSLIPSAFYIAEKIMGRSSDIVHLFWGHYPTLVGYILAQRDKPPVISVFLGAYDLQRKLGISRWMVKHGDCVFTHSEANLEPLKNFSQEEKEVTVAYRGIDLNQFSSVPDDKLAVEPMRTVSAGRLIPEKGMDDVIRAFALVRNQFESAQLMIMGDGADRSRLENLSEQLGLSEKVCFLGHVSETRVFEEMAKADVFLFMSDKTGERLPNVVKEAMISRCLCVSSHTPGMEELIEHGRDGYLVEPGDVQKAASIVINYFSTRNSYQFIKDNAENKIRKSFLLSESASKYKEEWKKALNK